MHENARHARPVVEPTLLWLLPVLILVGPIGCRRTSREGDRSGPAAQASGSPAPSASVTPVLPAASPTPVLAPGPLGGLDVLPAQWVAVFSAEEPNDDPPGCYWYSRLTFRRTPAPALEWDHLVDTMTLPLRELRERASAREGAREFDARLERDGEPIVLRLRWTGRFLETIESSEMDPNNGLPLTWERLTPAVEARMAREEAACSESDPGEAPEEDPT